MLETLEILLAHMTAPQAYLSTAHYSPTLITEEYLFYFLEENPIFLKTFRALLSQSFYSLN